MEDGAFDEASSPLSDQALLPAVLEDDDAQRNGGSHANFPKGSCSETRGQGDGGGGLCVACLLPVGQSLNTRKARLLWMCQGGRHKCVSTLCTGKLCCAT